MASTSAGVGSRSARYKCRYEMAVMDIGVHWFPANGPGNWYWVLVQINYSMSPRGRSGRGEQKEKREREKKGDRQ
ncbi:hypothetical protein DPMN_173909 [Dreissena polymorpha]|uniref:Uncharacterized protein n=1 Tax=Dreissena polymorpha TaxID=45954 RepID=A0A9D4E3R8_DREPO|nr:hypothetical protein DPMN_173909 [Dreissena polymorpha]